MIRLVRETIDVAAIQDASAGDGALCLFLGVVRGENDGRRVIDVARKDQPGDRGDADPHELRDAELQRLFRRLLRFVMVCRVSAHWFCPTSMVVTFAGRGT